MEIIFPYVIGLMEIIFHILSVILKNIKHENFFNVILMECY